MNKKLVGAIIAVVLIGVLMAGCVEQPAPEEAHTPEPVTTPKLTPKPTPVPTPAVKPPAEAAAGGCEMCHKAESTADLSAHVEGGQSCFGTSKLSPCHSAEKYGGADADVHTVHPPEVTCRQCHMVEGKLVIPETGKYSSCEACHGYPNPLDPSDGRLVEIHLDRGRDCTVCHVGEISQIHGLS
jgi:hypothetical protein